MKTISFVWQPSITEGIRTAILYNRLFMNFKDTTIFGLFDNSIQNSIPVYQRAYSWKEDNWSVFLSDLLEQMGRSNEYSYGNLLLISKTHNPSISNAPIADK